MSGRRFQALSQTRVATNMPATRPRKFAILGGFPCEMRLKRKNTRHRTIQSVLMSVLNVRYASACRQDEDLTSDKLKFVGHY